MIARDSMINILLKIIQYKLARNKLVRKYNPITLTFSITSACQSKCKTCNIGLIYRKNPEIKKNDLRIEEIEKIFQSIGKIYFFNVSGGEPFLRKDLPEIVRLACQYLKPEIIHIPTNAIASRRIKELTLECLNIINEFNSRIPLTVKPSIDGIHELHDEIRGVKGNFKQLEKTISYLKELEIEFPNFYLELGTVISNFNINHLEEIEDYVHGLGIQSYRNEIAEQRTEFFNLEDAITPDAEAYERIVREFSLKIKKNLSNKRTLAKFTESLRLVYYDLAVDILRQGKQVIPCFGGISNVHINYDGEVWPCCVLGYAQPMGWLRDAQYDFQRIWGSYQAQEVRTFIRERNCACPLANQAYSNILCSGKYVLRFLQTFLRYSLRS